MLLLTEEQVRSRYSNGPVLAPHGSGCGGVLSEQDGSRVLLDEVAHFPGCTGFAGGMALSLGCCPQGQSSYA
jgi:hypothetical protein